MALRVHSTKRKMLDSDIISLEKDIQKEVRTLADVGQWRTDLEEIKIILNREFSTFVGR